MVQRARILKVQILTEEELGNMFALERDKFENEKEKEEHLMEELKGELLVKEKEIAEQREKNFIEKSLNKQRVKQVIFRKLDEHYGKRIEIQKELKEVQDENEVLQGELLLDERALKKDWKEQEASHQGYLYNMKFEKLKDASRLRDEYERRIYELQNKFKLKNDKIIRDLEIEATALIKQLEGRKKEKILQITGANSRRYKEIDNYFLEITTSNLNMIKQLKFEIKKAQRNEDRDKKCLALAQEEERQLRSPLKRISLNIEKLEKDKQEWMLIKHEKQRFRDKIEDLNKIFRVLEFEYEVKFQENDYSKVQLGKLKRAHQESLFQVQQKSGLRNLVLSRQLNLAKKGSLLFAFGIIIVLGFQYKYIICDIN